jgi:hypothetical protein
MEFTSVLGSQHSIEPIGYHQVRKRRRRDVHWVVRSINEQFMIHTLAADFQSPKLYIPKPINIESRESYTMEMLYFCKRMNPSDYATDPELFEELIRFKNYMYIRGYFAAGFSVLAHPELKIYMIVDFSQFGTIDQYFVMFPKIPHKYTILEAEQQFGLIGRDIVTESFKKKHTIAKSPLVVPMIHTSIPELSLIPPPIPAINSIIMDDEIINWEKIELINTSKK